MAFEMATYGLVSGLVYPASSTTSKGIYLSLVPAMVVGRIVWGIAQVILMGLSGGSFTFQAFIAGALIKAVPAIVLQLILIPLIIAALQRQRFLNKRTLYLKQSPLLSPLTGESRGYFSENRRFY